MPEMAALQRWLDAYVDAWRTYDPIKIGALFTEDAVYAYRPDDLNPERGRQAIVDSWLKERDDPGTWECEYRALAVDGEVGVGTGWTRYRPMGDKPAREYRNLFVMRFAPDGRCKDFTEWFLKAPPKGAQS